MIIAKPAHTMPSTRALKLRGVPVSIQQSQIKHIIYMHCHEQSISHLFLPAYYKTGKVQDLGKCPQRTLNMKIGGRKHET